MLSKEILMLKRTIAFFCVMLCLACSVLLSSCSNQADSLYLSYFNTSVYIQSADKTISQRTKDQLNKLFSSLESQFDANNQNSFIYKFNKASQGSTFTLSTHGKAIFNKCIEYYNFTDKYYNPAVLPLVKLWQFFPDYPVEKFSPPSNEQIEELLPLVDFESVSFNSTTNKITKNKQGVQLDFGGVLKGYAVECACEILLANGHSKGYVSVGSSSIKILNAQKLNIRHPRANDNFPLLLSVDTSDKYNISVSSSGDYEKFYFKDGVRYSHIINPLTGKPSNTNVQSVNILGVDGAFSDALTTAGCIIPHTPGNLQDSPLIEFLNKIQSTFENAMIFVAYDDGNFKQLITNQEDGFSLLDSSYSIVKIKNTH